MSTLIILGRTKGSGTEDKSFDEKSGKKITLGHNWGLYRAVKCRLIWHFRGQALLLRVLHVVACDNVRDCAFLKDDLNRVKKGLNSYKLNFSLPTNSQHKLTEVK